MTKVAMKHKRRHVPNCISLSFHHTPLSRSRLPVSNRPQFFSLFHPRSQLPLSFHRRSESSSLTLSSIILHPSFLPPLLSVTYSGLSDGCLSPSKSSSPRIPGNKRSSLFPVYMCHHCLLYSLAITPNFPDFISPDVQDISAISNARLCLIGVIAARWWPTYFNYPAGEQERVTPKS